MGSYDAKASQDLQALLEEMPMKDCDAWIAALLRKNELLGDQLSAPHPTPPSNQM
jgi:hypothetical protein